MGCYKGIRELKELIVYKKQNEWYIFIMTTKSPKSKNPKNPLKNMTPEEIKQYQLDRVLSDLRSDFLTPEPTHVFQVGQKIQLGGLVDPVIKGVYDDGKFYLIEHTHKERGNPTDIRTEGIFVWTSVFPESSVAPVFSKEDRIHMTFMNRNIDGLLHTHYNFGIKMDMDYQRGNVWTNEQEVSLIHSIFSNIEIGKFAFIKLDFKATPEHFHSEILDGKQRLTALTRFFENKFTYEGYYYKDLQWKDRMRFENFNISWGETSEIVTNAQKYEYFLKLNTTGAPMDKEHIAKVKGLLKAV